MRRKRDFGEIVTRIEDFLRQAGWAESRKSDALRFFTAPESLGVSGKYSIALPIEPTRPGIEGLLLQAVNALRELYGYSISELYDQLATRSEIESPARFSMRFVDESTSFGTVPLSSINVFLANMERGLYHSAKFKLGREGSETKAAAQRFSKECKFLQTAEGSFVARVEVPVRTLREGDLLVSPVHSTEVCSSLFSAIEFINERIFQGDEELESEAALAEAIRLFDPDLLESLSKLLIGPAIERLEFSMEVGSQHRISSTGSLTEERADRLKSYVDFIKRHFYGEDNLDVKGSIVELRSRDPAGNRNYILVVTDFHGDRTFVSATLTNEQYQRALDAHRNKRQVRIRGSGTRLKTQLRVTEISEFIA